MAEVILHVCDREHDEQTHADPMTVRLDDREWRIDLCDEHRQELEYIRQMLTEYLGAGREVAPTQEAAPAPPAPEPRRRSRGPRPRHGQDAAERQENISIRAWARSQGIEVSERGRIPNGIKEQYRAAQNGGITPEAAATPPPQPDLEPLTTRPVEAELADQIVQGAARLGRTPVRGHDGVVRWTSG